MAHSLFNNMSLSIIRFFHFTYPSKLQRICPRSPFQFDLLWRIDAYKVFLRNNFHLLFLFILEKPFSHLVGDSDKKRTILQSSIIHGKHSSRLLYSFKGSCMFLSLKHVLVLVIKGNLSCYKQCARIPPQYNCMTVVTNLLYMHLICPRLYLLHWKITLQVYLYQKSPKMIILLISAKCKISIIDLRCSLVPPQIWLFSEWWKQIMPT